MCGICGIVNFNSKPVGEAHLRTMMETMKHRGPDDEGFFAVDNVGLGAVRLSIIDLSVSGHQPMTDASNRFTIVYNGEVYNYVELGEELRSKGYRFRSKTDTEVVLYSYLEWGDSCLNRFNGMFAFAIYDHLEKKIFAARDRFGIKPFYYQLENDRLIFASEISPILSLNKKKPVPNNQAIFDYLVFSRTDVTEDTFFSDVIKLQHGCKLLVERGQVSISRWYNLSQKLGNPFTSLSEYRELVRSAIGLRLRSDVPVGVCLSGGIDSSTIVCILLKDYGTENLNTFSAVYGDGMRGDESPYIDELKDLVGRAYFIRPSAQSLFNDMFSFVKAQEEPVPSCSPYAQFKVMELAKEHVVVTLDGQGLDEQLAGYHYFFGFLFKGLLSQLSLLKLANEIYHYIRHHRSTYGLRTFLYLMLPSTQRTKSRVSEKGYLHKDFIEQYSRSSPVSDTLYASRDLHEALMDHFEFKLEHLLKWEDRNSMWFSLEARVPFLDYRLVERTLSLRSGEVIKNGVTKNILREAFKGTLPERIRLRMDKIGFATPADDWFRSDMFRSFINDLLNSAVFRNRGYIDAQKARELYGGHLCARHEISKEIWKWINLELWFREFIDYQ